MDCARTTFLGRALRDLLRTPPERVCLGQSRLLSAHTGDREEEEGVMASSPHSAEEAERGKVRALLQPTSRVLLLTELGIFKTGW